MNEPDDDSLIPAKMRYVSILDCSPGRLDRPDGEWAARLLFATDDGVMESLAFSWKDMLFLANEIRDTVAHVDEKTAKDTSLLISNAHQEPRPWQESESELEPRRKPFISDLLPTGLTLRKWIDGKLQIYEILGGFALPEVRHYILLCRHDARPRHDFNLLAIQDGKKLVISIADDHPAALKRQGYIWKWFANWGTRKPVPHGTPLANVRKLSLTALKKLIGKQK